MTAIALRCSWILHRARPARSCVTDARTYSTRARVTRVSHGPGTLRASSSALRRDSPLSGRSSIAPALAASRRPGGLRVRLGRALAPPPGRRQGGYPGRCAAEPPRQPSSSRADHPPKANRVGRRTHDGRRQRRERLASSWEPRRVCFERSAPSARSCVQRACPIRALRDGWGPSRAWKGSATLPRWFDPCLTWTAG